ncbi:archaellin/type IV pilin N-terminal domain-containing protein [Caldivirga sp.]|uniref:archaellin/type IV pilin N-terminal domain-containing protein n=1 Tax=Caldivirga sp. TaxID=2080243 RepID=UPI003D0B5D69
MANRRGISNVIATIILIAVAIALAVAVAIWAFGLFRSNAHAGTLSSISQDLYVSGSTGYLVLYVSNPTGTTQNIVSVTLGGSSCNFQGATSSISSPSGVSSVTTVSVNGVVSTNGQVAIAGGTMVYLVYTCTGSYTPGVQYSGTIYLSSGSNIPFTVVAQAIS